MQPTRRSNLFLLELMIAILLFCLAATICVQVFVKSHTIQEESTELNRAVLASASVAEILRSQDTSYPVFPEEFSPEQIDANTFCMYFDETWAPASSSDARYTLLLDMQQEDTMLVGAITVYRNTHADTPIYTLTVKKYIPKEENRK